jgi:hypothetical protein
MSLVTPEAIAQEYGGNKKKIAEAARLGLVDPAAAVMAGMFIDQMRAAASAEQSQDTTVAQDVFGLDSLQAPAAPTAPTGQQQGVPAAQMAMAPQGQPMMPSSGVEALPAGEVGNYAGGGIVAFDDGGAVPGFAGNRGSFIDPEFRTTDPAKLNQARLDILNSELRNEQQALNNMFADPQARARAQSNIDAINREIANLSKQPAPKPAAAAPAPAPARAPEGITALSPDSPEAQTLRAQREARLGGNLPPSPLNLPAIGTTPQQAMNVGKVIAEEMYPETEMPKPKEMKEYLTQQKELMAEAGVDPEFFKKQAESLAEERRQGKLDKEEAKNMRILEAGLRIMSGTSPFAMVNIGAGGSEAMKSLAEDIKEMRKNEKDLKKAERELATAEQKYNLDLTTASQNRYDKAQARYDALRDNKVKLQGDIGKAVMSSTTQKEVAGIYTGSAEKVAEMREKALPDIMKAVDSPQMKNAMPGASFLDRLEAYARATQPKDVQNAIINATTQAKKQSAEEFQMALTYNSKLREDWTKAQQGDKDAQRRVDEARTAIERRAMQGIPQLPGAGAGPTTGPRPELSPQDREALNWANSNPNDPRAAQIKARLGVQ